MRKAFYIDAEGGNDGDHKRTKHKGQPENGGARYISAGEQLQAFGDQPEAIQELVEGVKEGKQWQVLMGATGTGKTFTISNVIAQVGRPTLVFAHNKTLASQLYAEFKEFFPHNHVEYFVSYFDYYQPEAYIPKSDTYIDKNTKTNEELDMLRLAAANAALNHRDTIIVASVASIYGASNPAVPGHDRDHPGWPGNRPAGADAVSGESAV